MNSTVTRQPYRLAASYIDAGALRFARHFALANILALGSSTAIAAQVLNFDFEQPPAGPNLSSLPLFVAPHLTVSAFSADFAARNDFVGNGAGFAFGATAGWTSFNLNHLSFTITVEPGYRLSLTDFGFDERSNGGSASMNSGPTNWRLYVFDLAQPAASGVADNPWAPRQTGNLNLANLTGTLTVTLTAGGAPSLPDLNPGTWRIDNFELGGAVTVAPPPNQTVPMPSAALLVLGSLLGLAGSLGRRPDNY